MLVVNHYRTKDMRLIAEICLREGSLLLKAISTGSNPKLSPKQVLEHLSSGGFVTTASSTYVKAITAKD